MTNPNPVNMAASVRQRLKNIADQSGRPFAEVLQWYVIERFLARLVETRHKDDLLLKGAALLRTMEANAARPTMDVDFGVGRILTVEQAVEIVNDCLAVDIEPDGLEFDLGSVIGEPIRIAQEYPGVRIRCIGTLGNARAKLQVDIGFGDAVVPAPIEVNYPALLGHPEPRLLGFSPETVVAEKLEAIVNLGVRTSRMKDYFDLNWLAKNRTFDGAIVRRAIVTTFAKRRTAATLDVPEGLSDLVVESEDKQRQWAAFVRRMGFLEPPEPFENIVIAVRAFVMPVLEAIAEEKRFERTWVPGVGWRD
jgi:predicted nucleotidyltransferase component of viral defense system